ncbi:hypothetical protein HMPREF3159_11925 [Brachybacterium sp. HMSC06H03]|uniref:ABC transporter substrate-binding protein n=1 Tax=Brachybacterium sp. HMSC06H03 TaxID=1581127 RepID=UPI0008A11D1F|nr:sugar ABC transporter substrate-binding protein [Brachybacterium sp. HMSC06H03]OFT50717.1 hypothetical protein HMPREF3159_11925 [Brachybacterium sp. HMSC06H03]
MPTVKNTVTRRHAVAAGLTAMTALAAGCNSSKEVPPPKAVDAFDWKNFSGETLSLLMSEHPVSIAVREHLPEFEELTGITVSLETLSETDYMVKLLTVLQSGTGSYDAFMSSQPMNFQYAGAGWIEDLLPWVEDPTKTSPDWDFEDFYPALIESLRWDRTEYGGAGQGSLWAIPANEEGYALFYRKDVLEREGIAVPETIDDLIDAASQVHGTVVDGIEINGFVSRGDKTYPTLNPFSTFFLAHGAVDIVDGRAAVNSPESIAAVEQWVELMQYAPVSASTYTWYEAQQDFISGKAVFYIDADHMAPDFEKSPIGGKVGYALPPSGPQGRGSSMWVWSLGMNAASRKKDAAWQFIQWATSKEFLTTAIESGNMNPTRTSVADSDAMSDATAEWGDYNDVWQEILAEHAGWAYTPSSRFPEIGDAWTVRIQSAVLGQQSPQEAMDEAAEKINAIIED